jgi:hypothetical protein
MEKTNILTVAIPTYNRHEQLKSLHQSFLARVDDVLRDDVEIIVLDNSDEDVALHNANIFTDTSVNYFWNEINIGFSGNVLNCVKRATGHYLWIISDDDDVHFDSFSKFVDYLLNLRDDEIKFIMLPFEGKNFLGEKRTCNTSTEWNVHDPTTVTELISNGCKLPFVLFSSVVVCLDHFDRSMLDAIRDKYQDNAYMQIAVFLKIIGMNTKVFFYSDSLQTYNYSYEMRFNMESMRNSYRTLIKDVCQKDPKLEPDKIMLRDDWRWLGWSLWSYIGLVSIPGEKENRSALISSVYKSSSIKNIVLSLMFFVPAGILRKIYICVYSFKCAYRNGDLSFSNIKKNMAVMNNIGK